MTKGCGLLTRWWSHMHTDTPPPLLRVLSPRCVCTRLAVQWAPGNGERRGAWHCLQSRGFSVLLFSPLPICTMRSAMGSLALAVVAIQLLGLAQGASASVVELTDMNFASSVDTGCWFVKFYAPVSVSTARMCPWLTHLHAVVWALQGDGGRV